MSAARRIEARVRVQRGDGKPSPLLVGAHRALRQSVRVQKGLDDKAPVELTPEHPPGDEGTLSIERDKRFVLDMQAEAQTDLDLPIKELRLKKHSSEARILALALATIRVDRHARKMDVRLEREVLTMDRIDGRLVWALGGESMALWVDRETYRPARLYVGPGVLDDDAWTVKMTYHDDKPGRGWFPHRMVVSKNEEVVMIVHALEVTLHKR